MASINHPFSIAAKKDFSWEMAKKCDHSNRFNSETGPGDKRFRNFKRKAKPY